MNLEALRTEFLARGFDYLSSTRADNYLNDSYLLDICEEEDWPFLEGTQEGVAPLTISDLRAVEYVVNITQRVKLDPMKEARVTDEFTPDLTTTGIPQLYYITAGTTVNVYPVSTTDEISVRYFKVPTRLTGTAIPSLPERFHSLIVDGAVARAYEDADDYELAQAASTRFQERLERMRISLGMLQHDAPDDFVVIEDPAALR